MGPHAAVAASVKPGMHGSYGINTVTASCSEFFKNLRRVTMEPAIKQAMWRWM